MKHYYGLSKLTVDTFTCFYNFSNNSIIQIEEQDIPCSLTMSIVDPPPSASASWILLPSREVLMKRPRSVKPAS